MNTLKAVIAFIALLALGAAIIEFVDNHPQVIVVHDYCIGTVLDSSQTTFYTVIDKRSTSFVIDSTTNKVRLFNSRASAMRFIDQQK